MQQERALGFLAVAASSLFFYLCTIPITLAKHDTSLEAQAFTFARFFAGALVFAPMVFLRSGVIRRGRWQFLLPRGIANYASVWLFFKSVEYGDPGLANTLNLTYPVFGVVIALLLKDEKNLAHKAVFSGLALLGVIMVLGPNLGSARFISCCYGLASGITASLAIKSLQYARGEFDASIVLGSMFLVGLVGSVLIDGIPKADLLTAPALKWLALSGIAGLLAQYFLTWGANVLTSVEVGIISTSRVVMAVFIGWLFALDKPLTLAVLLGTALIFLANIGLAWLNRRASKGVIEQPIT